MRHRNSGRKLGRTSSHRKAMLRNLSIALLTYGRITTTEAKAKEVRGVVEPLIRLSRNDDLHSRREAYRVLGNHKLVKRLFVELGPLFKDMDKGGYTRVLSLAFARKGDCAPLAMLELLRGAHYDAKTASRKEDAAGGEAAAKTEKGDKAAPKPKAVKSGTRNSQVMNAKPKITRRKMEG